MDQNDIAKHIKEIIIDQTCLEESQVKLESKFEELGLDSLDKVELIMAVEYEFGITIEDVEAEKLLTVQDAVDFVVRAVAI